MIFLFKIFARLPLGLARAAGVALGWFTWTASSRHRNVMRKNFQIACDSGQLGDSLRQPAQGRQVLRHAVGHSAMVLTELPKLWCDPGCWKKMRVEGIEPVLAAVAEKKGVVILTPHLGAFELSARVLARYFPITVLYRPARSAAFGALMEALRPMTNLMTAPANAAGVKQLLRALKQGQAIGMLPDQVPSQGEGVWAEFFGRPAYTMTLPMRLAQATGAALVWCLATRVPGGWTLELRLWDPGSSWADWPPEVAARAMNQELAREIARAPEQYLWAYKRYKVPRGVQPPRP